VGQAHTADGVDIGAVELGPRQLPPVPQLGLVRPLDVRLVAKETAGLGPGAHHLVERVQRLGQIGLDERPRLPQGVADGPVHAHEAYTPLDVCPFAHPLIPLFVCS
jgi:hypothetical protein